MTMMSPTNYASPQAQKIVAGQVFQANVEAPAALPGARPARPSIFFSRALRLLTASNRNSALLYLLLGPALQLRLFWPMSAFARSSRPEIVVG
jgi:hypothetical protein